MLDKKFVRAEIRNAAPGVFKATITYSYYGLYNYNHMEVFKSLQGAKEWILNERCHDRIYYILDVYNFQGQGDQKLLFE